MKETFKKWWEWIQMGFMVGLGFLIVMGLYHWLIDSSIRILDRMR